MLFTIPILTKFKQKYTNYGIKKKKLKKIIIEDSILEVKGIKSTPKLFLTQTNITSNHIIRTQNSEIQEIKSESNGENRLMSSDTSKEEISLLRDENKF